MRIKVYIKKYIAFVLCLIFVLTGFIFEAVCLNISGKISDQNIAKNYGQDKDYAHITLFTSATSGFNKNNVSELRGEVKKSISENVVAEKIEGRTFLDAYLAIDKLDFTSQKSGATIQIYAVSGDFFTFHPMMLSCGSYFSDENDENSDGIVLNELAAWALFGATNVSGMLVEANDVSMPVRGVVKDMDSKFSEASGENIPRAYLSFDKYQQIVGLNEELIGTSPICCYEALIINPVKNFAINSVKNIVKLDEYTFEYIINSERFSLVNRLLLIKNFFNRVMNKTGVVYPYWENYARAKEQVVMLLTILEMLNFLAGLVFLIIGIVRLKPEFIELKGFIDRKKEDLSEFIKAKQKKRIDKKEN